MRLYRNCSELMDDDPNWLFKALTFLLHSDLELEQARDSFFFFFLLMNVSKHIFFGHSLMTE